MAGPNDSELPNGCPGLAVGGEWWGKVVFRAGRRVSLARPDADADWFVALNYQNDEHPAEGRWADWVALARKILEMDAELSAKKVDF